MAIKRGALRTSTRRGGEFIREVKETVNVQLYLRSLGVLEDAEDFGEYLRGHCVNPDHTDSNPTMLVYADGANCAGCGLKADILDLFFMFNPQYVRDSKPDYGSAADLLLAGNWKRTDDVAAPKEHRAIDQGLADRYHFQLAEKAHMELRPGLSALDGLLAFGFSKKTIRKWKLGLSWTLVRLLPGEYSPELPEVEWLNDWPYQHQWRYSVPVFYQGDNKTPQLVQMIYRKSLPEQLGGKITSEKGAGSWLFNRDVLKDTEAVIVAEGWGDVLMLDQNGFNAVCSTAGAGHWNNDWCAELGKAKRIYVVGDADQAGEKMVAKVKKEIPWARPIFLPFGKGSKQDIRDFFLQGYTADDLRRRMAAADRSGGSRLFKTGGKQL